MEAKGEKTDVEEVMKNLLERDYIDSHRETSPLTQAEDAIVPPLAEGCALPEGWRLKTLGRKLMLMHPRVFSMILK